MTQDILKEVLNYDKDTGIFTRKSGKIAGTKDRGYLKIGIKSKTYMAHRLAWLYMTGSYPDKSKHIDHLNHNREDNSFSNLSLGTVQDNQKNRNKHKNNTSGQMGVYPTKNGGWYAQIWVDGKGVHLGSFKEKEDAIKARIDGEKKYGYHVNHGLVGKKYKR